MSKSTEDILAELVQAQMNYIRELTKAVEELHDKNEKLENEADFYAKEKLNNS